MASYLGRRKFLATLGGAVVWPLTARAQQGERMRRIGVLTAVTPADDPDGQARLAWLSRRSQPRKLPFQTLAARGTHWQAKSVSNRLALT